MLNDLITFLTDSFHPAHLDMMTDYDFLTFAAWEYDGQVWMTATTRSGMITLRGQFPVLTF